MILTLRKAWAASSMISEDSLDSAMFSLSCLMPLPPVLGVPFLSITLSHSFLASLPPLSLPTRSMTTGNSPLKRGSLAGSIVYLSIFSRSRLTPGTVSTRPSKEALIWNSLNRQAMTQPVVALERPTWSLTMMGVLMEVPTRVLQMMSKSASLGAAELHTGTLICTRPGKSAFRPSMTSERVFRSLTSTSFSSLLMVKYFSLPPFSLARPSTTFWNSSSSALTESLVTFPSSAYSPILLAGLAQMGSPLTYTLGSCQRLRQLLDLVEGAGHGRGLPYLRVLRHPEP